MPVSRRWVVAAGSAACFAGMSREAWAEVLLRVAASGKPVLTEKSLNAAIPKPSHPDYLIVVNEAAADVAGFLRANFTLTEQQEKQIDSITGRAKRQLGSLIAQATMHDARLAVDFVTTDAGKVVRVIAGGGGGAMVEIALKG